ncbi:MAG: DUF2339 domain-containing protein [Parasphingorhabdus sp.]
MIDLLLFGGLVVLIILFSEQKKTVNALRARLEELEINRVAAGGQAISDEVPDKIDAEPASTSAEESKPIPEQTKIAAKATPPTDKVTQSIAAPEPVAPTSTKPKNQDPKQSLSKRFEDLIGGKLPIWIGGIALVFAGFFLVRFSIEAGYFGPTMRCITAALFGLLLIGMAEYGKHIPRFGNIFTDDLRIGHSIAGAGIAVLYATLYMASELYGLLSLTPALIGVIGVTVLAFFLSQKHGPPTAIMGLLGGFAAPYVAGLGPESIAPMLIYLGVFTAGLFGLAIHRGWAWLALLATGGSAIWTTALLLMDVTGDIPFIGAFVVLLAIGGVLTLARTEASFGVPKAVMQSIPLAVGLLQLILLAPLIEFSPLSWFFFAVLAVFSVALAWRDDNLTPAVAGALGLAVAMVFIAFSDYEPDRPDLIPAIGFAVLFGIAGHAFTTRPKSGWMWAMIGLAAPGTMLLAGGMVADFGWSDAIWGGVCFAIAITSALMAWRTRALDFTIIMPLASAMTAILLATALWHWAPSEFTVLVAVFVAGCLAVWARFTNRKAIAVETAVAVAISGLLMLIPGSAIIEAIFASLAGETDLYSYLPKLSDMVLEVLVPSAAIIALAFYYRETLGTRLGGLVGAIGFVAVSAFLYLLYKQPLAIGPVQQFVQYGFAERALLTNLLAVAGWLLVSRNWSEGLQKPLRILGLTLAGLSLFRFIYFDLFLLSPTSVKQDIGPAPLANLGTLHFTAAALWLWLFARDKQMTHALPRVIRPLEIGSLFAAIAAAMITVRQAVHGSDIATPPFTSTETYLYSAGLLLLAIAWLMRGIKTSNALLRISGLLLLTIVTFKVFLIDAAQLDGILRILSFLGLGIALIGIGWIYGKVMRSDEAKAD